MTDKVQLIKEEIEKMYKEAKSVDCFTSSVVETTLERLSDFIDSLPEEPASKDLEESAKEWAENHFQDFIEVEDDPGYWCSRFGFIAGAEWQKQQMMKDAIECVVEDWCGDSPEITIPLNPQDFKTGDRVKIIIVKEECYGR